MRRSACRRHQNAQAFRGSYAGRGRRRLSGRRPAHACKNLRPPIKSQARKPSWRRRIGVYSARGVASDHGRLRKTMADLNSTHSTLRERVAACFRGRRAAPTVAARHRRCRGAALGIRRAWLRSRDGARKNYAVLRKYYCRRCGSRIGDFRDDSRIGQRCGASGV